MFFCHPALGEKSWPIHPCSESIDSFYLTILLLNKSFCWRKTYSLQQDYEIKDWYRALIQSTSLLWCFHKELIQCSLIWRFHNPYSFRARPRLSNEGWIFWIRFCNDLRVAPCVNARGPLYSQIWHHSKLFPFSFASVKKLQRGWKPWSGLFSGLTSLVKY